MYRTGRRLNLQHHSRRHYAHVIQYDCCNCSRELVARGGKSLHCNNFGSYGYYKRRGERVDFMPGCDPKRSNACVQAVSIADLRLRKSRQKNSGEVGWAA